MRIRFAPLYSAADLDAARKRAKIGTPRLAKAYGCVKSWIWAISRQEYVTEPTALRYIAALERLTGKKWEDI